MLDHFTQKLYHLSLSKLKGSRWINVSPFHKVNVLYSKICWQFPTIACILSQRCKCSQKLKVGVLFVPIIGAFSFIGLRHRIHSWTWVLRVPGWKYYWPWLALSQPTSSGTSKIDGISGSPIRYGPLSPGENVIGLELCGSQRVVEAHPTTYNWWGWTYFGTWNDLENPKKEAGSRVN